MEQTTEIDRQIAETPNENKTKSVSFDEIYREIGEFGLYQILVGLSSGLAFAFGSFSILNFIFGAAIPNYRCFIADCEQFDTNNFDPEWGKYAIPYKNDQPERCSRYQYIGSANNGTCSSENFNQSLTLPCSSYIIKNHEDRLVNRLNMFCTGEDDKLALIGLASTFGRFLAKPVTGIISDKYGRLLTIIGCSVFGAVFCSLQALPPSIMTYKLYWFLEFLASFSTTGAMGAGIVFNTEWVTSKYRVFINTMTPIVDVCFTYIGIGLIAWKFESNFFAYKMILSVPGFFFIFLYFLLGESPQWLMSQHRYEEAIKSLSRAGKMNGKPLTENSIQQIREQSLNQALTAERSDQMTIWQLFKQKTLAFRLLILSLVWLCAFFAYFGSVLGSTRVHENKYLSYIIIGLADIPGAILTILLLDRLGRRYTIGFSLIIYGVLLAASIPLTASQGYYRLILLVISKIAITTALTGMGTYTTEFWPTAIRNSAYNISGMAARFGTMLASISVLSNKFYAHLPVVLYGSAALFASVLLFAFLPETVNCKLPNNIEEAVAIGKPKKTKRNGDGLDL